MKIIKHLSDMIEEELEGAEDYAKGSVKYKEDNPTLARVFYEISLDEMKHVGMLHGEVTSLIEKHRREKGDPPEAMMAVYNYLHEKHIDHANKVKMYQSQYKEG